MGFVLLSFWQQLELIDRKIFLLINDKSTNNFFDFLLPYFRDSVFWAPLYIFIIAFMIINYGKKGVLWTIFLLCTVAIADLISAKIMKESFERIRPCNDPFFQQQVKLLVKHCGSGFSFTSNHAANHFAIAAFITITLSPMFKRWIYLFYLWAFAIAYAQVYVGVHYPFDVIAGAVLGTLAGVLTSWMFKNKVGSFTFDKQLAL